MKNQDTFTSTTALPSRSSLSYHVSMLQVNIVLQQLSHHLDVTLLGCRDQRRPAVLRTETTCYSGNCHRTQKTASGRMKKGPVSVGWDAQDLAGRCNLPIGRTRCSWARDAASA